MYQMKIAKIYLLWIVFLFSLSFVSGNNGTSVTNTFQHHATGIMATNGSSVSNQIFTNSLLQETSNGSSVSYSAIFGWPGRTTKSVVVEPAPAEEGGAPSSGVGGGGGGGGGTSQPTTAAVTLPVPTPVPAAPSVHEPAPAPSAEQLTLSEEAAIAPGEEAAPVPSTAERAALAGRAFFQGAAGIGRYWILFAVFFLVVLVSFVTLSLLRREYRTLPGVIKTPKVLPLEYPLKKGEIISRTGKKVLSLEAEFAQISGQLDRLRQVEIDRPRVRMTVPATVGHSTESLLLKERWQQHHKSITSLLQKSIQKPNVLLQHLRPKKISKKILLAEKKAAQQVRHIDAKLKHGTSGNELLRIEDEITKLKKQLKKERKNFNE